MPLDPVLVLDTRAWFLKALTDLRGANADLAADPPVLEDVLFHSQQAVEKAMKGFLAWRQQPFGKTHDLRVLGKACRANDGTLAPLVEKATPLTWYAWKFRYPGALEEPAHDEVLRSLATAREFVEAVLARLPNEVRP